MEKTFSKKTIIGVIIVLFCFQVHGAAQLESQELFAQGNEKFLQGRFALARESYLKINNKSSSVWQNIGNCFFNEKKYAQALVCWKRAQISATWHQLDQLFTAEKKTLSLLKLPVSSDVYYGVKRIILIVPKLLIQILLFLMLSLLLLFLYRCWSWSTVYSLMSCNYMVAWFFMIGIMSCSVFCWSKDEICKQGQAIVIKEQSVVYAGPERSFHKKTQLPLGYQIDVLELDRNMYKVMYRQMLDEKHVGKRQVGWVESDSVEIV